MSMMEAVFKKQRKTFEKQVEEQNRGYRKPQKINIERNIQYGEDKLQTFDMIFPTDAKPDIKKRGQLCEPRKHKGAERADT